MAHSHKKYWENLQIINTITTTNKTEQQQKTAMITMLHSNFCYNSPLWLDVVLKEQVLIRSSNEETSLLWIYVILVIILL